MHGQLQFVPLELHPGSIFGVACEDTPTQLLLTDGICVPVLSSLGFEDNLLSRSPIFVYLIELQFGS